MCTYAIVIRTTVVLKIIIALFLFATFDFSVQVCPHRLGSARRLLLPTAFTELSDVCTKERQVDRCVHRNRCCERDPQGNDYLLTRCRHGTQENTVLESTGSPAFVCAHRTESSEVCNISVTICRMKGDVCENCLKSLWRVSNSTDLSMIYPSLYWCWLVLVVITTLTTKVNCQKQRCTYTTSSMAPEVYFINMDSSKARKTTIENHLNKVGLRHFRVRGLTPQEIYIPPDIESTWRTASCKVQTEWMPPNKLSPEYNASSPYINYTAYMATLCGRGKDKNTPKELGCTTSHLVAMRRAIYSTTAKSRYALIIEDDVYFPFDIDFDALVASAPKGFGILQLFNSNSGSMQSTWDSYLQNNGYLWTRRHPVKFLDFWSTCAYLIDRVAMKPVIDAVVTEFNGWVQLKVIAGINNPCVPKDCCKPGTSGLSGGDHLQFIVQPPCVWAPRGYQADHFLYAMTTTYMLSVPIITNGQGGNESTFHQSHVEMFHKKSFQKLRGFVNEMLTGKVTPPAFVKPACSTNALDVNLL